MVKQISIDTTPSQVETNTLGGIPLSEIIGSPLKATIETQAITAPTTWKLIQEVGRNTDENGQRRAANVSFNFLQDGRIGLNVPILNTLPIPDTAINSIDITYKAGIKAEPGTHTEASDSEEAKAPQGIISPPKYLKRRARRPTEKR